LSDNEKIKFFVINFEDFPIPMSRRLIITFRIVGEIILQLGAGILEDSNGRGNF